MPTKQWLQVDVGDEILIHLLFSHIQPRFQAVPAYWSKFRKCLFYKIFTFPCNQRLVVHYMYQLEIPCKYFEKMNTENGQSGWVRRVASTWRLWLPPVTCKELSCGKMNWLPWKNILLSSRSRLLLYAQQTFWWKEKLDSLNNNIISLSIYSILLGNHMILLLQLGTHLHYEWYLKIVPKLHEPLDEYHQTKNLVAAHIIFAYILAFTGLNHISNFHLTISIILTENTLSAPSACGGRGRNRKVNGRSENFEKCWVY